MCVWYTYARAVARESTEEEGVEVKSFGGKRAAAARHSRIGGATGEREPAIAVECLLPLRGAAPPVSVELGDVRA